MKKQLPICFCFLLTIVMLVTSQDIKAQCIIYRVTVEGQVHSDSKDARVFVRVHANRGQKTSEVVAVPQDGHFHIEVGFDTFVSVHLFGAHNCSRRPTGVDVILLGGGTAKQTVRLSLERDFMFDEKLAEWQTKVPVVLEEKATSRAH